MFLKMRRYREIRDVLPNVQNPEVKEVLVTHGDDDGIYGLLKLLTDLDSVTVEQKSDLTPLLDARLLFYGVLGRNPILQDIMGALCAIVENTKFEEVIWKVQRAESLNDVAVLYLGNVLKSESSEFAAPYMDGTSIVHRLLKRPKKDREMKHSEHIL